MNIRIQNQIRLDGELESLNHSYKGKWTQKGGTHYLVFDNEEKEKTVLKFDHTELVMTRFSVPKSIMCFAKHQDLLADLASPVGVQQFLTQTHDYKLDIDEQTLCLDYDLKTTDGRQILAHYQMTITWGSSKKLGK